MLKRVLSAFLAFVFLLVCAIPALAEDAYLYRSQLKGEEVAIYDTILKNFKEHTASFPYTFAAPVSATDQAAADQVKTVAFRAFEAVYRDHPEIFWISKEGISFTMQGDPAGQYTGLTLAVTFNDIANVETKQKDLDVVASDILKKSDGSEYEKLKLFHDTLTGNCDYDTAAKKRPASSPDAYEANGALVKQKAVCEGYSKAFKLLCDKSGIPCVIIGGQSSGQAHMWNYVQLNEAWYLVDCTFDDPVGGEPEDTYFLKGADSTKDHTPGGGFLQGFESKFVDPPLSKKDFDPKKAGSAMTATAKSSCTVRYLDTSGGKCVVNFSGAGPLDNGQIVAGGITLMASAVPRPGYVVSEINVKMGKTVLTASDTSVFYFTVTDDCTVSAVFEPA